MGFGTLALFSSLRAEGFNVLELKVSEESFCYGRASLSPLARLAANSRLKFPVLYGQRRCG